MSGDTIANHGGENSKQIELTFLFHQFIHCTKMLGTPYIINIFNMYECKLKIVCIVIAHIGDINMGH